MGLEEEDFLTWFRKYYERFFYTLHIQLWGTSFSRPYQDPLDLCGLLLLSFPSSSSIGPGSLGGESRVRQ